MIKQSTINQVFETSRVEDVIGDFVQLKRSGSNFKGLSPFSDERTPSFMVSPAKQIWKDFSSGKGGSVVSFLMEHESYSYPEAIKFLANKYGIEIEETEQTDEEKEANEKRESLFIINDFARDYFVEYLHQTDEGKSIGLSYLRQRNFTDNTIKTFELGLAPDEWTALADASQKNGFEEELVEQTGLIIKKEDKKFDRFKGRLMFPIHSLSGRILGFGGRILKENKKAAKYLNSPESPIYDKSSVLYGIYFAKRSIVKEDNCYLVEGYTDVIQLYQNGVENVVSSSGTALTQQQARLIYRFTKNITLVYDGDRAGIEAALRGVDVLLAQGLNVNISVLPEEDDPDSFAQKYEADEIKAYLKEQSKDIVTFKAEVLSKKGKDNPADRAEVVYDVINSIAKIPDEIQQDFYIRKCSSILEVAEDKLFAALSQAIARDQKQHQKRSAAPQKEGLHVVTEQKKQTPEIDQKYVLERNLIRLLIFHGHEEAEFEEIGSEYDENIDDFVNKEVTQNSTVFDKIYKDLQEDEIEFTTEVFQEIYQHIQQPLSQKVPVETDKILKDISDESHKVLSDILFEDSKYRLDNWKKHNIFVSHKSKLDPQEVVQTILSIRKYLINAFIQDATKSLSTDEGNEISTSLEEIHNYNGLKVMIADKLERVT
jgi:DNA primase